MPRANVSGGSASKSSSSAPPPVRRSAEQGIEMLVSRLAGARP